ncbi:VOC family protein [Rothia nasimurium]|uniref:VOC family protein n=1 Tax=Rothia nasimurium TaxID=85336 RepID=UPI001F2E74F5|nr:VOC family protein [Rothia nasimurium]
MTSTFRPISAPTACVWINGDAAEAATYYAQALPLTASAPAPDMGTLNIDGADLLLLGADATYSPNPSISGFLRFSPDRFGSLEQAEQALRHAHTAIGEGGELMPLQAYPFAPLFAWVRDRYGFTWQLFLEETPSDLPFFTPCFMFGNVAHGKCEEATNTWMELLGGERLSLTRHGEGSYLDPEAVQMTTFTMGGGTFTAIDAGTFHDFTFDPGVSMALLYQNQVGIDGAWSVLSQVADAERCGWCVDAYGVSWQVLPQNIGQLMTDTDACAKLLSMGKIDLNQL